MTIYSGGKKQNTNKATLGIINENRSLIVNCTIVLQSGTCGFLSWLSVQRLAQAV